MWSCGWAASGSSTARPIPVKLWAVMDESVLYRKRGDDAVMREQLAHLLELSAQRRIDIQVLPFDAGSTPALDGGNFKILRFPAEMEGDPGLVYLELLTGGQYVEKPEEIAEYQRAHEGTSCAGRKSEGISCHHR